MTTKRKTSILLHICILLISTSALAQVDQQTVNDWQMRDATHEEASADRISSLGFETKGWMRAVVPGTILTSYVQAGVYPEPLYGENMRTIPESLNKVNYWYRAEFAVPKHAIGVHTWIHFGGINYAADVWVNGKPIGSIKGAFKRGDFDISEAVRDRPFAAIAVLVHPQPHVGTPHEHTQALGVGKNGGDTAVDGPTFLSTIGWDWLAAVRDRDTGIWLPVTIDAKGEVNIVDPFVTATLSEDMRTAQVVIALDLHNTSSHEVSLSLNGTIDGNRRAFSFSYPVTISANSTKHVVLDSRSLKTLEIREPALWWPNGYGEPTLYSVQLEAVQDSKTLDRFSTHLGIRKLEYGVTDAPFLTMSVNGVKLMIRGGDWALDEAMKRIPRIRLEAQMKMHAQAHLNMIRNWVGQSSSPDFYDLADKYGILLWDEFFQPNPLDGPDVADLKTYMDNARDKVVRYRNHPSIAVWCARNEGYPPKEIDDELSKMMSDLDPTRLYQSNSAEGRGVSSHGPYYWRAPRYFYALNEAFKTETGSVSIPTIESIQGMMPTKDWEVINDDWAQHDLAAGAQRGDEYPQTLAKRYGKIRNLADFVRKGQLANYEAFRAMFEGRNAKMFTETTGVLTWMSQPAQPSFVWQLYHYDLEPNSSLFAVQKAAESVHVQMNEADRSLQIVNNTTLTLKQLTLRTTILRLNGSVSATHDYPITEAKSLSVVRVAQLEVDSHITPVFFVKLELEDDAHHLLSTNFYWQNVAQDDFAALDQLPGVRIRAASTAMTGYDTKRLTVTLTNEGSVPAVMVHLQLHRSKDNKRVLPVFYSDNYVSLTPGESRVVSIEFAATDLKSQEPKLLLDGLNVEDVNSEGSVESAINENALPLHWPATAIVPSPLDHSPNPLVLPSAMHK